METKNLRLQEISCCRLLREIKKLLKISPRYELWYEGYKVPGEYMIDIDGKTIFNALTKRVVTEEYLLEALMIKFTIHYPGLPETLVLEKHNSSTYDVYYGGLLKVPGKFRFDPDRGVLLTDGWEEVTSQEILELLGLKNL